MFNAQDFAARLAAREGHWPLLKGWGDAWCASFQRSDGCFDAELERAEDRLGVKLPASLRELYCFAGRRLSKMNDSLIELDDLEVAQNVLPFWAENQYVWTCGVKLDDLSLDDPPVFIDFSGCDAFGITPLAPNRLALQNEMLSEFAFQIVVGDYMQCGPDYEDFRGEGETAKLLQSYQPLGFPDQMREHFKRGIGWVEVAEKFFGNEDKLAYVIGDSYVRVRPRDQKQFLRHIIKGR